MLPGDEIESGLKGAWQLMLGRTQGLGLLDLSADGFWNSFHAIVVSFPPLFAMWTLQALDLVPAGSSFAERAGLVTRMAIGDVIAWVAPLAVIAYGLTRAGMKGAVSPYIVANNWFNALINWLALPFFLLASFVPSVGDPLLFGVVIASVVLTWRLNHTVLRKGAAVTSTVTILFVLATIVIYLASSWLLGIPDPPQT